MLYSAIFVGPIEFEWSSRAQFRRTEGGGGSVLVIGLFPQQLDIKSGDQCLLWENPFEILVHVCHVRSDLEQ